jgi:hypothetical protein
VKIDLTTVITTLLDEPFQSGATEKVQAEKTDGTPITDGEGEPVMVDKPLPLTMRDLLLGAYTEPDAKATWKQKLDRGSMAQRLYKAAQYIELKPEQVIEAKELISRNVTAPVAILRAAQLLDPTELPEDQRTDGEAEVTEPPEA